MLESAMPFVYPFPLLSRRRQTPPGTLFRLLHCFDDRCIIPPDSSTSTQKIQHLSLAVDQPLAVDLPFPAGGYYSGSATCHWHTMEKKTPMKINGNKKTNTQRENCVQLNRITIQECDCQHGGVRVLVISTPCNQRLPLGFEMYDNGNDFGSGGVYYFGETNLLSSQGRRVRYTFVRSPLGSSSKK